MSVFALSAVFGVTHADGQNAPKPLAPAGYANEKAIRKAFRSGALAKTSIDLGDLAKVVIHRDLVYAAASSRNVLDVYRPRESIAPAPIVLFVHGGAWDHGDKKSLGAYAAHFAARGYVCMSMNYRLSDNAPYPAAVDDVRTAVAWARANAANHGGDAGRIALVGYSAGAHLVMLCAYKEPGLPEVQCVVDMYGPVDLTAAYARRMKAVRVFLDGSYREVPDRYRAASPLTYVRSAVPPTLIVHGDADDVVPVEQAETLARALEKNGVRHEFQRLAGWDHAPDRAAPVFRHCVIVMDRFFKDVLAGGRGYARALHSPIVTDRPGARGRAPSHE
ncbi:MAG: alpha/beta hydrolase [Candidatus Hydrogenedentes bacterium]|nr:alpha/beta hydrolase [Candidatus Hydrogenedentota bacterium]